MSVTVMDAKDTVVTRRDRVPLALQDKEKVGFPLPGVVPMAAASSGHWNHASL